jgi:hypothetical protein
MAIKIGNNNIDKAYLGANQVSKMYLGANIVFNIKLTISPVSTSEGFSSTTYTINLLSNANWNIKQKNNSWVTLSAISGNGDATITVTVQTNPNSSERSDFITFTAGDITIQHTIIQSGQ